MTKDKINIKLTELMVEQKLSKSDLCLLTNISISTINNYCNNTVKLLDVHVLEQVDKYNNMAYTNSEVRNSFRVETR